MAQGSGSPPLPFFWLAQDLTGSFLKNYLQPTLTRPSPSAALPNATSELSIFSCAQQQKVSASLLKSLLGVNMYEDQNEPTNAVSTKTESSSAATRSGDTARALIRRAKQASRRRFPSEEKIRILLEGVRAEVSVAELCRREGIHPTVYYKWLKDFMEAGKKRLRGDTQREANREEVEQLRQENQRLKQLVADLSLANMTLKKSQY